VSEERRGADERASFVASGSYPGRGGSSSSVEGGQASRGKAQAQTLFFGLDATETLMGRRDVYALYVLSTSASEDFWGCWQEHTTTTRKVEMRGRKKATGREGYATEGGGVEKASCRRFGPRRVGPRETSGGRLMELERRFPQTIPSRTVCEGKRGGASERTGTTGGHMHGPPDMAAYSLESVRVHGGKCRCEIPMERSGGVGAGKARKIS
jgi:hypothetical protein